MTVEHSVEKRHHYVATEKLWLTADRSKVVRDGHRDAAFLFTTPGKRVTDADVERYGLAVTDAPEPADTGSGLTVTEEPEVKEQSEHEDKALDVEEDKSTELEEDAHVCPECGFVAKSAGGLSRHSKTHEEE